MNVRVLRAVGKTSYRCRCPAELAGSTRSLSAPCPAFDRFSTHTAVVDTTEHGIGRSWTAHPRSPSAPSLQETNSLLVFWLAVASLSGRCLDLCMHVTRQLLHNTTFYLFVCIRVCMYQWSYKRFFRTAFMDHITCTELKGHWLCLF